jgi:hypothetical protein
MYRYLVAEHDSPGDEWSPVLGCIHLTGQPPLLQQQVAFAAGQNIIIWLSNYFSVVDRNSNVFYADPTFQRVWALLWILFNFQIASAPNLTSFIQMILKICYR